MPKSKGKTASAKKPSKESDKLPVYTHTHTDTHYIHTFILYYYQVNHSCYPHYIYHPLNPLITHIYHMSTHTSTQYSFLGEIMK